MFKQVISKDRQDLLELLGRQNVLKDFYLAGGTAAAIHMGHRMSEDFDFFCRHDFETFGIIQCLSDLGTFTLAGEARGTVHGILNGVKLSFLFYRYPLLYPAKWFLGCRIADLRDIALMKITAISGRGSKRDFIDLFFIINETMDLAVLLRLFEKKYRNTGYSQYHLLKSLAYFEDADREPDPVMLKPMDWNSIKKYFLHQQKELLKKAL
ncbi:MAG: nucleotidyl transferase AbiEii/AbiGii toxin family protein, partial [Peptococcaceae bacterium]|nr:nucleotidyl transferase AbiEii/AbiGii toxin family protein [Peptococcaceae bacterium]